MARRFVIGPDAEVVVGRGLLSEPGAVLPVRSGREKALVVAQPTVRDLATTLADGLDVPASVVVVTDRDDAKTPAELARLWDVAADVGLGRHDTIVGLGGGAATDLAGFLAATWMRGVEAVLVPTTLLAAVDAAIGGKTAINLAAGKNLVGAFWMPTRVVVDLDVLDALPGPLRREGFAEALKAGAIADPTLFDLLAHGPPDRLDEVVERAVAVKVAVVSEDPTEAGRREVLNLGHTLGHAYERALGLAHGDAVAIGLVAEAAISEARHGFADTDRIVAALRGLGLPTGLPRSPALEDVLEIVVHDKKRRAEGVRMVLLRAIGDVVVEPVDVDDLAVGHARVSPDAD